MNKLSTAKRCAVVAALVEGNSIRATARMTDVSKPTILKLIADLGPVCAAYQNDTLRELGCRRLECDEIWQFVYAKQKNVQGAKRAPKVAGDVWTWVAIDADSKLVPTWRIGPRDAITAHAFMTDLADRLKHRVQLTTDGLQAYVEAVEDAFGMEIDYAQLIKIYGADAESERRYSPVVCQSCVVKEIQGEPDPKRISTSYIERQNLTMRMSMRRYTRLTNGFSRKLENHAAATAIHFMHYNFARIHRTIRMSPAMAAGVTETLWTVRDIVGLLEEREATAAGVSGQTCPLPIF